MPVLELHVLERLCSLVVFLPPPSYFCPLTSFFTCPSSLFTALKNKKARAAPVAFPNVFTMLEVRKPKVYPEIVSTGVVERPRLGVGATSRQSRTTGQ